MRICLMPAPIHEAQVVRGDDGMDHVEYELLVVSVFPEPVTLSSVAVLDPAGKKLMRIEGSALATATQTLFARKETPVIPASAAASVDVDLILPPSTAPERVKHRIAYTLAPDSERIRGRFGPPIRSTAASRITRSAISDHAAPTLAVFRKGGRLVDAPGKRVVGAKREDPHCPRYLLSLDDGWAGCPARRAEGGMNGAGRSMPQG